MFDVGGVCGERKRKMRVCECAGRCGCVCVCVSGCVEERKRSLYMVIESESERNLERPSGMCE